MDARQTVLLVEDEILVRMALSDYLRQCGYRVVEAASADEAILVLGDAAQRVDVVLSDAEMPGTMDGFGLARWVREHRPAVRILLVGSPAKAAGAAADLCEDGPHLAKPYDPQIVLDRIRRMLAERQEE